MQSTMQNATATPRKIRQTVKDEGPNPIDISVGYRIKQHRLLRSITQEQLAAAIGVSFQQVQKYERGLNRVSASVLYQIACFFKVSPEEFFGDCEPPAGQVLVADKQSRQELDLLNAIRRLSDEDRALVLTMAYRLREAGR